MSDGEEEWDMPGWEEDGGVNGLQTKCESVTKRCCGESISCSKRSSGVFHGIFGIVAPLSPIFSPVLLSHKEVCTLEWGGRREK